MIGTEKEQLMKRERIQIHHAGTRFGEPPDLPTYVIRRTADETTQSLIERAIRRKGLRANVRIDGGNRGDDDKFYTQYAVTAGRPCGNGMTFDCEFLITTDERYC